MTTKTLTAPQAPPAAPAAPLSLDERLALAALAVDARIQTTELDLADVIRLPIEMPDPEPEPCPYSTPVAACLWRAAARVTRGWCTGRMQDEDGRVCLRGAIHAETSDWGVEVDACTLLLEVIQQEFPDAETVPSWNDAQAGPARPTEFLRRAALLAADRGI